jgi:hypothetical protein
MQMFIFFKKALKMPLNKGFFGLFLASQVLQAPHLAAQKRAAYSGLEGFAYLFLFSLPLK